MTDTPRSVDDSTADGREESARPIHAGDVLFMTARSVANPGFAGGVRYHGETGTSSYLGEAFDGEDGQGGFGGISISEEAAEAFSEVFGSEPGILAEPGIPTAEAIFVLTVEAEGTIIGVRLGVMSTNAVANHLPDMAQKLTKPKVFFIGGEKHPIVLGVGYVKDPMDAERAAQEGDSALFGKNHQFLYVHTGESAPSLEEQIARTGGTLKGLRLFHSYVTAEVSHIEEWKRAGLVDHEQATFEDVFTERPGETWRRIMARRPFPENLFVTWAQHPERN
ncbi:hypothetical protein [Corynebacterium anserum]|uniref:Uncharacterized protein n=1 Tax=Corynebacterium anserum TaxID=2684406 RepID=A0A7G7YQN2_9CORY|nr:hypothetical protein [Corynebacterium anserum]MBC2682501.1 hypothetical protein [Corynebacterium anserum]QNH96802.1 hypothetical protein GP473_09245 [Corynebacterium anserum]